MQYVTLQNATFVIGVLSLAFTLYLNVNMTLRQRRHERDKKMNELERAYYHAARYNAKAESDELKLKILLFLSVASVVMLPLTMKWLPDLSLVVYAIGVVAFSLYKGLNPQANWLTNGKAAKAIEEAIEDHHTKLLTMEELGKIVSATIKERNKSWFLAAASMYLITAPGSDKADSTPPKTGCTCSADKNAPK